MIDYVKLLIYQPNISKLKQSEQLDFKGSISVTTGEVKEVKLTAIYHFCTITIHESGRVYFTGSIHKMWNSLQGIIAPNYSREKRYKGYNGNLYTLSQIHRSIQMISNLMLCKPQQMIFQNIEIGVNAAPHFDPQIFIKGLIMHYGKGFELRYSETYAQATHERYYLKIYNKSNQYGMSENTLRIELKIKKTEDLKRCGVRTMADINKNNLEKCKELLLSQFEKVLYYDYTIRPKEIKPSTRDKLKEYSNTKYWLYDLPPNRRHRPKENLNKIIRNHSGNLKAILSNQIIEKWIIINRQSEAPKCVIINRSNIGVDITHITPRICPITRIDISMQKDDSFLLSNTGLKFLEKNAPKIFKNLVEVLLTGQSNKFEKSIYDQMSKQIRNRYFNTRTQREIQATLFT